MSDWISVKERLPEAGAEVLAFGWHKHTHRPFYILDACGVDGEWIRSDDTTHWQPLPEPPEEVDADATD